MGITTQQPSVWNITQSNMKSQEFQIIHHNKLSKFERVQGHVQHVAWHVQGMSVSDTC